MEQADSPRGRVSFVVLALLVLTVATVPRVVAVADYRGVTDDGAQYWRLSRELVTEHRFAYFRAPNPLAYSRLPGYPLFLAFVGAGRETPQESLRLAAVANVALGIVTALVVLALLRALGARGGGQLVGAAAVLVVPVLVVLTCYGLSETLATFLTTLQIYLAVRASRSRFLLGAALAGAATGCAQLVRADAIATWPAVGLALLLCGSVPRRERIRGIALAGVCAALVFSPWPLRNLVRFGAPHALGSQWVQRDGTPLSTGPVEWMRTWSTNAPGEAFLSLRIVNRSTLDPDTMLPASAYDDEAERQRVVAVLRQYNEALEGPTHELLPPSVDRAFVELGHARTQHDPWRTYVSLPRRRVQALWAPAPQWELPIESPRLGLPRLRGAFAWLDLGLFILAAVGALRGLVRARRVTIVLIVAIATRTILHAYAVPHGVTQRYLAEVFPLLVALAAYAVDGVFPKARGGGGTARATRSATAAMRATASRSS